MNGPRPGHAGLHKPCSHNVNESQPMTSTSSYYHSSLPLPRGVPRYKILRERTRRLGGMKGSTRLARLKYHTKYCAVHTCGAGPHILRHSSNTECIRGTQVLLESQFRECGLYMFPWHCAPKPVSDDFADY